MHLDFKIKVNKIDSQQFANIEVPQIDWLLNEATELFIKNKLGLNNIYKLGFEGNQKRIEDLRPLVVKGEEITTSSLSDEVYTATLPSDYLYYVRSEVEATKGDCTDKLSTIIVQHDDLNNILNSEFFSPSFEWRETPAVFSNNTLFIYSDGSFTITKVYLDYLKKPKRIQYPEGYENGEYRLPNNQLINTNQDSDFKDNMFAAREIVDLAVVLATTNLGDSRHQLMTNKLNINE